MRVNQLILFGKTHANVLRSALRYNVYSFAFTYARAHSILIANCFFLFSPNSCPIAVLYFILFHKRRTGFVKKEKKNKQKEYKNDSGNDVAHDLNFGKIASIKKYIRLQKHIHITHTRALVLFSNSSHTIYTY